MSYKIKDISKQVAKEHPEFLSRSERVWLFAEQHRGAVIAGVIVAGVVAILLGALVWVEYQNGQAALALEHQAAQAYLDRSLDDLDAATENLNAAIALYRQILEDYPRTTSAHLAWYFIGNALAEQNDYPGAIDAYHHFINQTGTPPALLGLVYQRLGATYLANGDRERGLEAYQHVLNLPHTLNKDQVLFELAKLEEYDNRSSQALALYQRLVEEHPGSPYASEATMRVKVLEQPAEESAGGAREEGSAESPEGKETEN